MHHYQEHTVEHILAHPACGIFLDMGLGKTVSTLTALDTLLFDYLDISKILISAPKRVAEHTWHNEIEKWAHLKHLTISKVLGTERQRLEALRVKADIYITNRENIAWLVAHYGGAFPFDCLVLDELSSYKNSNSVRFKALRMVRPKIKRVIGLTGTPAPNGLEDLWGQLYLLDMGERLGNTVGGFRGRYLVKQNEHAQFSKRVVRKGDASQGEDYYERKIYEKISDICISMKARDYLDLPKRVDRIKEVHLPAATMQKYLEFEKQMVLAIDDTDDNIFALSAGVLTNKLRQFANGAIFDDNKNWHEIHEEKLDALEDDLEEANGNPVMVFYNYKHDLERILTRFKAYKPVVLKGPKEVDNWNAGKINMLVTHAASAGHGLNLQYGGHLLFWFGLDFNLELYDQGVTRLDRQGQKNVVINTRIIAKGTIDEDVLEALNSKSSVQDAVMHAVRARKEKYLTQQTQTS